MISPEIYTKELCQRISLAIKQSGIYSHIDPIELIRNKINEEAKNSSEYSPPEKKIKNGDKPIATSTPTSQNTNDGVFRVPMPPKPLDKTKSASVSSKSVTSVTNTESMDTSEIPENVQFQNPDNLQNKKASLSCLPLPDNLFNVNKESKSSTSKLPSPNMLFSQQKSQSVNDLSNTNMFQDSHRSSDVSKDRPKSKLSNLANAFLPAPNQIFTKSNIIESIKMKNHERFTTALKSVNNLEAEFSKDDVYEIIQKIIDYKLYSVVPELCNHFKNQTAFISSFSEQFINNTTLLMKYKNEFLNCIESMIDAKQHETIQHYVKASIAANEWNSMLKCVFDLNSDFKLDKDDFDNLVGIFKNYMNRAIYFSHDTVGLIISYIIRHHKNDSESYMADVWIYCMYHDILNVETGETNDIPENIMEKVICKLVNSCSSYIFAQKLLLSNWSLLEDSQFCDWIARMISDKTADVKKNLQFLHDSLMKHDSRLIHHFYLLSLCVMRYLNKKCLFTVSYSVYDFFVKSSIHQLRVIIDTSSYDRFNLKWCIVEALIQLNRNEEALFILTDFHALEDLEEHSLDYTSAKKALPNLIWNLIGSNVLDQIIVLFQKLISIFVITDRIEQSYIKNCQQIFESMVNKAYEKPVRTIMLQLLNLVRSIISWNLQFAFTQEALRKLLIGALELGCELDTLTEYLEMPQFKCVLPNIQQQSVHSGGGSSVDVPSNLDSNEICLWIAWIVRNLKIRLVEMAQSDNSHSNSANLLAENLTRICSLTFHLRRLPTNQSHANSSVRDRRNFQDFIDKFTQILGQPKYLSVPLQYTVLNKASDSATIVLDSKSLYNCIYYSDL